MPNPNTITVFTANCRGDATNFIVFQFSSQIHIAISSLFTQVLTDRNTLFHSTLTVRKMLLE